MALAWGALGGAVLQVVVLLPSVRALLGELGPRFDARDGSVREAARRLPGALLGRGVIQLSGLVDTLLVSFLGTGANAVLGYAQMIYLLPMALLGTGEAAVALPELAGDTAERDEERRRAAMRARLGRSLARVFTLTVPTALALIVFGRELCALLLQTGSFDRAARDRVVPVVAAYGFALLANASGRVLGTTLYALGDTHTPARYALVRVVFSTAVSVALMWQLGVLGVVLGAVAAAWLEVALLVRKVRGALAAESGGTPGGGLGLEHVRVVRVLLAGALPALAALGARYALAPVLGDGPLRAAAVLGVFGAVFLVAAQLLGLGGLRSFLRR
jgi:putative peptidoglycan lipid II flippase